MNWREHVTVDPEVCHGRACITDTRVPVSTILDNLAAGLSPGEITKSYPSITRESIQAALSYAAELARLELENGWYCCRSDPHAVQGGREPSG